MDKNNLFLQLLICVILGKLKVIYIHQFSTLVHQINRPLSINFHNFLTPPLPISIPFYWISGFLLSTLLPNQSKYTVYTTVLCPLISQSWRFDETIFKEKIIISPSSSFSTSRGTHSSVKVTHLLFTLNYNN